MPTRNQLETALRNADAAGDVEAARALASALKSGDYDEQVPASNIPIIQQARERPFTKGFTDPAAGISQLVEKTGLTGKTMPPEAVIAGIQQPTIDQIVKQEEKAYQQGRDGQGIDWGRIAGNIASPVSLAGMSASVAAPTLPAMMGRGAAYGGAFGATQPVVGEDFASEKTAQVGLGAAGGAAIPVLGKGLFSLGKAGGQLIRPFTKKGITKDIIDLLVDELGPQRAKVVEALSNAKQGETASQALARHGVENADDIGATIVRLERDLAKKGGEGFPLRQQYQQQEMGRKALIDAIKKTPEERMTLVSARTKATDPLYKAVEGSNEEVVVGPVLTRIDEILAKNPNETSITVPLNKIKKMMIGNMDDITPAALKTQSGVTQKMGDKFAKETGMDLTGLPKSLKPQAGISDELAMSETSPQALASLSKEIKAMIGKKNPGGQNEYNVKVLDEIKGLLDDQIGQSEKAFKQAQELYRAQSVPINRIDVGSELAKSLRSKGKETPAKFITATDEAAKTLKRSTGFPRYNELGDVLSPEEVSSVDKVSRAMMNKLRQKQMAGDVEAVLPNLEGGIEFSIPNMLSRPALVANAVLRGISKAKTAEYNRVATEIVQNPQLLAKYLQNPPSKEIGQIARKIYSDILPIVSGQVAGQAGEQ